MPGPENGGDAPEVRNTLHGDVAGSVWQIGAVHGDVSFAGHGTGPDQDGEPLLITSTIVRRTQLSMKPRRWWRVRRLHASGDAQIAVVVEARSERAVILRGLRPHVVSRRQRPPAPPNPLLAALEPRAFDVVLDPDSPFVRRPPPWMVEAIERTSLDPRRLVVDFPFTVTASDPECFLLAPRVPAGQEVRWNLNLDWTFQGRSGTALIDDNGTPFRTRSSG